MNNTMFIKTSSEDVAKKLRSYQFTEISKQDNFWCFLNDGKMMFSEEEKKNVIYTNTMCL